MSRFLLLMICIWTLSSCSNQEKKELKEQESFYLFAQDSLFSIKLPKLANLDTIHDWVDVNCTLCTMEFKRRIQSTETQILQESGMYYSDKVINDSVYYRITLEHIPEFSCPLNNKRSIKRFEELGANIIEAEKLKDPELIILKRAIVSKNNDNHFLYLQFIRNEVNGHRYIAQVHFDYKLNPIIIRGECANFDCANLFMQISKALENLEINHHPKMIKKSTQS